MFNFPFLYYICKDNDFKWSRMLSFIHGLSEEAHHSCTVLWACVHVWACECCLRCFLMTFTGQLLFGVKRLQCVTTQHKLDVIFGLEPAVTPTLIDSSFNPQSKSAQQFWMFSGAVRFFVFFFPRISHFSLQKHSKQANNFTFGQILIFIIKTIQLYIEIFFH